MMNNLFLRVSLQEKLVFAKNLALTLKAGVSLVRSLQMLEGQARTGSFRKIIKSLIEDTNKGMFLSAGLEKFKPVFGELFINVIRVAETSGTLPENLIYLGDELKKKSELRKKVRGAMIYPVIILIATVIIATTMIIFVFPKILPLFENFKSELPFTTRLLIKISEVVSNYGIWLLIGVIAFLVAFRLVLKISSARRIYHSILFYLPLFGTAIVNFNMANMARTLGLLLRSGVKIIEALAITGATLTNLVYRSELEGAAGAVRKGEFISRYFRTRQKRFPAMLINLLEIGENTGNLTENLFYLAEHYEAEVDDFVKNLSGILEPVLLLFMGGIVGFIALSFITPIYQLTRQVK